MPGDTVAKKVKELNDVKVIIVSAYDLEEKMVEELKRSGSIVDFIKKPVSITCLIEKKRAFDLGYCLI